MCPSFHGEKNRKQKHLLPYRKRHNYTMLTREIQIQYIHLYFPGKLLHSFSCPSQEVSSCDMRQVSWLPFLAIWPFSVSQWHRQISPGYSGGTAPALTGFPMKSLRTPHILYFIAYRDNLKQEITSTIRFEVKVYPSSFLSAFRRNISFSWLL